MHPARPATPLTYATGIPACCWSAAHTFPRLQALAGHTLAGVSGVLITHEHMDHAKAARELHRRGAELYASAGVGGPASGRANVHPLEPYAWVRIGSLYIQPFEVYYHDVGPASGYTFYLVLTHERAVFAGYLQAAAYLPWRDRAGDRMQLFRRASSCTCAPDSSKKRIKEPYEPGELQGFSPAGPTYPRCAGLC